MPLHHTDQLCMFFAEMFLKLRLRHFRHRYPAVVLRDYNPTGASADLQMAHLAGQLARHEAYASFVKGGA